MTSSISHGSMLLEPGLGDRSPTLNLSELSAQYLKNCNGMPLVCPSQNEGWSQVE